jgi:hypothetical protein
MFTTFTITHFIYSEWLSGMIMPEDHIVTVEQEWQADNIFDVDDGLPSDPTSPELVFTVMFDTTATGLVVTNQNTGQSETILFDALFYAGLYLNFAGDFADFAVNPFSDPTAPFRFARMAAENWEQSTSLADFSGDTIIDLILQQDSMTDGFMNIATNHLFEQIQEANPSYVMPGDYMFIDGQLKEVLVDDNGDPILDEDGNPVVDEEGNTGGEVSWSIPTWMVNILADFSQVVTDTITEKLGIGWNVDLVPMVNWMFEHPGFMIVSVVLTILLIIAWPIAGPIVIQLLLLIPKTAIVVFKGLRMFFELLAHQMYSDKTKKAKF